MPGNCLQCIFDSLPLESAIPKKMEPPAAFWVD